jgi:transcription initiation factor TFIID subunit 7
LPFLFGRQTKNFKSFTSILIFFVGPDADHKHGKFFQAGKEFKMRLVNLPTIIEAHKTTDRKVFFKSGDVHQMLVVEDPENGFQDADVAPEQRRRWQFDLDPKKWEADSGITPPTHKIKQRKWRKMPEYTVRRAS